MSTAQKITRFSTIILFIALVLPGLYAQDKSFGSEEDVFITRWKTDVPGKFGSSYNQISLPLDNKGTYDFIVDWGDDTSDRITSGRDKTKKHTYNEPGIYTVKINGKIDGFSFHGYSDAHKLLEIIQWGNLKLGKSGGYFKHCYNLVITAEDIPDLGGISDMSEMFSHCYLLKDVPNIDKWDVSKVTDMEGMFSHAALFNSDISGWDISSLNNSVDMFLNASTFSRDLSGWDLRTVDKFTRMFHGTDSLADIFEGWMLPEYAMPDRLKISEKPELLENEKDVFISAWKVEKSGNGNGYNRLFVPVFDQQGKYFDFMIDWGDGVIERLHSKHCRKIQHGGLEHYYAKPGTYTIRMAGNVGVFCFNVRPDYEQSKLLEIKQWGCFKIANDGTGYSVSIFEGCTNMKITAEDIPDFSGIRSFDRMFSRCRSLKCVPNIWKWDISSAESMTHMFSSVSLPIKVYNEILIKFTEKKSLPKNIDFSAGNSRYTQEAQSARDILINKYGWHIHDKGLVNE